MTRVGTKRIRQKITEAMDALRTLGLPVEQQNDRSALTLLALLGLKSSDAWSDASSGLIGVTPIIEFIRREYLKTYAPNTRETIRRFTPHQFVQAGIAHQNPDDPGRPTNSPKNVYQIDRDTLGLLRTLGSEAWNTELAAYLASRETLRKRYARERSMRLIPLCLPKGQVIRLTPGGQNVLVKKVIEEFCPRFTPDALPVYVGDTGRKWAYFDETTLASLGVSVVEHGKIPDVLVYMKAKDWLVLIEAVTSHGPISPKRIEELQQLFSSCSAGLVFVTAFPDSRTFVKYAHDIAWETEVWIAEAPGHMIHYNGERFLGPY